LRARIASVFRTRSQAEWTEAFDPLDACGAPVLGLDELARNAHLSARGNVRADDAGTLTAAPAPRLSGHSDLVSDIAPRRARPAQEILAEAGYGADEVEALVARNIIWSLP
jgi:alpha-methylacyl-CoA racemase